MEGQVPGAVPASPWLWSLPVSSQVSWGPGPTDAGQTRLRPTLLALQPAEGSRTQRAWLMRAHGGQPSQPTASNAATPAA